VLSARLYDAVLAGAERRALRAWRRDLLTELRGTVLEIGAGTGANLHAYGPAVDRLLLLEPDPAMRQRLVARAGTACGGRACVLAGSADRLPLRDRSVDAVVSTLVLCSVRPLDRALSEIRRVLRPHGQLHVIEHVAAEPGTPVRRAQNLLAPAWSRVGGGCSLVRPTRELLEAAGFDVTGLCPDLLPVPVPFLRPVIRGTARP
jgi:ubiquinone/menaquinone biosynthesis C-methylase UbiE